jgi:hypothetical protein
MDTNTLQNFVNLLSTLAANKWFGEIKLKMENGKIVIGEKIDKIKFDNANYLEYKNKNK